MKIRTTLTLKYTGVTATVFLICMILIYWVSERTRSNTFFHDLKSEAITKAHLFLNNRADAATMQSIYTNNKQFINEVEVAVYTTDFRMLYHDAIQNDIVKEKPGNDPADTPEKRKSNSTSGNTRGSEWSIRSMAKTISSPQQLTTDMVIRTWKNFRTRCACFSWQGFPCFSEPDICWHGLP